MTINLVKLCVGADGVDDLRAHIERRVKLNRKSGLGNVHDHVTRMHPRREVELLDGGSVYWVIKGVVLARQPIVAFEKRTGGDGITRTAILMNPDIVLTEAQPRRAFQGWRYLSVEDAPADIDGNSANLPPELSRELAALGLL